MSKADRLARLRKKLADLDEHIVVTIAGSKEHPPIVIDYRTAKYVDGYLVIPRQQRKAAPGSRISTRRKGRQRPYRRPRTGA